MENGTNQLTQEERDEILKKFGVKSETVETEYAPVDERDGLKQEYSQMLESVKDDPYSVFQYKNLFSTIFAAEKEVLDVGNNEIYFATERKPTTNFGAIVLEVTETHKMEQEIEEVFFKVELLILSQHDDPKFVCVDSLELGKKRWIESLGVSYRYRVLGGVQNAIKIMAQFAPVTKVYHYSGWALDAPDTYILGGAEIYIKEGIQVTKTELKNACQHVFAMLNVAELRITVLLLSVALLSLVQSVMTEIGEFFRGVFALVGQSQSGKTELSKLFFDFENGSRTDINFDSTLAAIVRTIGHKRDATVVVDDYKPTSTRSGRDKLMNTLETIVRMCSDDSHGYQKAGAGNSTVSNVARCIVAITAEDIRLQVQSTLARLLIVEMNRSSVHWHNFTNCKVDHDFYQNFIITFILYISAQGVRNYCENLKNRFLQERNVLRDMLASRGISPDNRTSDQCTWLRISFNIFLDYALSVEAINQEEAATWREESFKILLDLMEEQAERIGELDDVTRFFKALRYLLDTEEERIEILQLKNSNYASAKSSEAIGFTKRGCVYLKNNVAFQKVVAHYKRFGRDFLMSESTLRKMLGNNGLLAPSSNPKSLIHRLKVNREHYQCIAFEEATFYRLLKGDDKNDTGSSNSEVPGDWGERQNADGFLGRAN